MGGPAQRADARARWQVGDLCVLLWYAVELARDVWRSVDCWIFCSVRVEGERPNQTGRSRQSIPSFDRRLEGQNFLDCRR